MRKTATRLTKVKLNTRGARKTFWCVSWPKIGKGRNRQFFKDKKEAETVLQQKLIEQENYGIAGVSFNERHRAEYLECAEALSAVRRHDSRGCQFLCSAFAGDEAQLHSRSNLPMSF